MHNILFCHNGGRETAQTSADKGTFYPKMNVLSLSTRSHATGQSGEVSKYTKRFWSLTEKQSCSYFLLFFFVLKQAPIDFSYLR